MDIAMDRSQEGKLHLEAPKGNSRLSDTGLPSSLDEAALLLYALSFGSLTKNDLARALKQVGMTLPDGSPVTIQRAADCTVRLRKKGQVVSKDYGPPVCPPEVCAAQIEAARAKGSLRRFGKALQQAVPGQTSPSAWEYKWSGRRFVSLSHACRDVFLALENDDQNELKRLAGLCSQDMEARSLTDVLLLVCIDPFQPAYIERLPAQYWGTVLTAATFVHVCSLMLDHPVFAYVRTRILADRHCLASSLLKQCVTLLAERDILAGDFAAAKTLLATFPDLDTALVQGMLELVQGHLPEARRTYDAVLRIVGKSKSAQMDHVDTFPGLLHTLLLVQTEEPEARQQARVWTDRFAANRSEISTYREAYRLLGTLLDWHEGHEPQGPEVVWHPSYHHRESSLSRLSTSLMQLLYWFYASQTKAVKAQKQALVPALEELLRVCEQHGARWPALQIARVMSRLGLSLPPFDTQAESFFQETPRRTCRSSGPSRRSGRAESGLWSSFSTGKPNGRRTEPRMPPPASAGSSAITVGAASWSSRWNRNGPSRVAGPKAVRFPSTGWSTTRTRRWIT